MNKRNGINRLGVKASHRKAIHRNMAISVFRHGRVKTTLPKARAVRRTVEKLITRAKTDSVHNRREVAKLIHDKDIVNKLFTQIATEFKTRAGGYTRVIKTGLRRHDAAEMALLELVGHGLEEPQPRKKSRRRSEGNIHVPPAATNVEGTETQSLEVVGGLEGIQGGSPVIEPEKDEKDEKDNG